VEAGTKRHQSNKRKIDERSGDLKREDLRAVIIIVIFYAGMQLFGITCPIRFLTGVSCAGCGMTRAWLALFRLDLQTAISYHPLFWLPVPAAVLLYFHRKIPKTWYRLGLGLAAAAMLAVYGIRMMDSRDLIVTFQPTTGWIWRTATGILSVR
jgi:hypothetical protein